jgi:hypothetical protein
MENSRVQEIKREVKSWLKGELEDELISEIMNTGADLLTVFMVMLILDPETEEERKVYAQEIRNLYREERHE